MRWYLLLALLATGPPETDELPIGTAVPDFTLQDLGGTAHRLSQHKGKAKAVVLLWTSAECPVSRAYEKRIQALFDEFRPRGVIFYAINSNRGESVANIRAHQRAAGLTYPVLKDPHNRVADAYEAVATPEVFLLDGGLKLRYQGSIDNHQDPAKVDPAKRYLRQAILALLAGRRPDPERTRGLGCAIDRE